MNETDLIEGKLKEIPMKRYLDVDYSKLSLFKRALFVFRSSYYGYESLEDNAAYETKFNEYVDLMWKVFLSEDNFGLSRDNLTEMLQEIDKEIELSSLVVHIRIAEYNISETIRLAKIVVYNCVDKDPREKELNLKGYPDKDNAINFALEFSQVKQLRVQNKQLLIEFHTMEDQYESFPLPKKLQLSYMSIHPEGYRTWFSFSSEVQCLVTIRFSVERNNYSGTRLSLTEHTHLIWRIFQYRFDEYLKSNSFGDAILQAHHNSERKTCSLHTEVDPQSADAFWPSRKGSTSLTDGESYSLVEGNSGAFRSIHCHELQLAYNQTDEPIEEEFCRCTEWCSVSSFYYHNPIFRLLMVQFTNFYIKANANLPSSYMCAVSYLFVQSSKQQIPISLLYILNSILSYMKLSYSKKIQFLVIDICSYKLLRSVNINNLVIRIIKSRELFSDQLVACINCYYQIFMYLHSHIGKMRQIVSSNGIDAWYELLYEVIYKGYNSYLYASAEVALHSIKNYSSITLFERFNSSTKSANFDYDVEEVIRRKEVLYSEQTNRLNVKFTCHPFIQVIHNISKFIVEIYHPLTNNEKKTQKCNFAVKFDRLLMKELPLIANYENEPFLVNLEQADSNPTVGSFAKKLHMLFSLKLYSYAFSIQQYFTKSLIDFNKIVYFGYHVYIPDNLNFVFTNDWIERTYSQSFPMENLFVDQCAKLEEAIHHFYYSIWPQTKLKFSDDSNLTNGILQEYCKLCLWWSIDGKNLLVFRRLLETFRKLISDCIARADNLFTFEFGFVDTLEPQASVNSMIKDNIALNLVQAVCFCLVKIVHSLIKSIHDMQSEEFEKKNVTLTLARPGIIELITTMDTTLKYLNQLKGLFIAFNDQSDSICQSIDSTELVITGMYRDLYVKLVSDWHHQVENLIEKVKSKSSTKLMAILHFALVIEMHFVVRFHRFFRLDYCYFKKQILKLDETLQSIRAFDYNKYKGQIEQIFDFEINCTSSTPFLEEPLNTIVFEALSIKENSKHPFEYLKQFKIDTNNLV